MKTLREKIFKKIEDENIKHKSMWYFSVRNIAVGLLTLGSILLSAHFSSAIFFILFNSVLVPVSIILLFAVTNIIILFVAVYLAYHNFQKIKNAYRTPIHYVVLGAFVVIFVVSFIFVQFRLYGKFDSFMQRRVPQVSLQEKIHDVWSDPMGTGMLAGEVIAVDENGYVHIEDFRKEIHIIDPVLLRGGEEETFLKYLRVRMFGFEDEGIFYPEHVEAWEFRQGPRNIHPDYGKPFKKGNIMFLPE